LVASAPAPAPDRFTSGAAAFDARLGGGLLRAGLHEVYASEVEDASAAAGFALILAARAQEGEGRLRAQSLVWVREERATRACGRLYALGLAELGVDPASLTTVQARDERAALRAGADAVKCGALGAVVIELYGAARLYDLTASRRLALAAAQSGVMVLLVRVRADPAPSAAHTRWQVGAALSAPLDANAPGRPAFNVTLLRQRGGVAGFETRLEWDGDARRCIETPLSGSLSAAAAFGADEAHAKAA
jgi:protein ImuA